MNPSNLEDQIKLSLPDCYAELSINNKECFTNHIDTAIIIPSFRRSQYVKPCLQSLVKSNFTNCVLIFVDESTAIPDYNHFDGFELFTNIDSTGYDIRKVNGSLTEIARQANKEKNCIAFNEGGWLKHSINLQDIHNNAEVGLFSHANVSFYIKKQILNKHPQLSGQLKEFSMSYVIETTHETKDLISDFDVPDLPIIKIFKNIHRKTHDSFLNAADLAIDVLKCEYLVFLDSDTLHKPNWLTKSRSTYQKLRGDTEGPLLVSGFNSNLKASMHPTKNWVNKSALGGVNLFLNRYDYLHYVRDTLNTMGWDLELSTLVKAKHGKLIALTPSVVQHIGIEGTWSNPRIIERDPEF